MVYYHRILNIVPCALQYDLVVLAVILKKKVNIRKASVQRLVSEDISQLHEVTEQRQGLSPQSRLMFFLQKNVTIAPSHK